MTTLIDTLHNLTSSDASLRAEAQLIVKSIQDSKQVKGYKSLCEALTTLLSIDGNTTQSPPVLPPAPEGESMCITTVGMQMYETLADCLEGSGGSDSDDNEDDDDDESRGGSGKGGEGDPIFLFARDSDVVLDMCLAGLTQQFGDSEDDSEWTMSTASSKLLQVILQHRNEGRNETGAKLMNFASQRLLSTVWQVRDAAFMATGCVCTCPDEHISHLVHTTILPILLKSIDDQNLTVADSVLWAISCACEHHHEALINFLDAIMTAVIPLISKPRAPGRSARALQIVYNLAKHCQEEAEDKGRAPQSNFMSPYLPSLIAVVVGIIKQDGRTKTERLSAVETLTSLVGATAGDCVHMLTDWFIVRDVILPRLEKLHTTAEDDDNVVESVVTACLCGTVATLCSRLGADIAPVSSPLCDALACAVKTWASTGNGCVEDGLMAIGALYQTGAMNNDTSGGRSQRLASIASAVAPILSSNVYNRGQYTAALACISDIVLTVQEDFKPHLPLIMAALLSMLENRAFHDMHPENKLAIFSTVGDICISCGLKAGEQYYSSIKTIFEAEAASTENTDEEELLEIISEALEILG